ncbi:protein Tob1-like [Oppia nitens]|uniref:protein Tob1-like n=1 Tax=Oppia nitens TaxID=1686743 RepID=UPI0023DA0B9F|nr:protein Tob1-like [Oppia nitens]XP_054155055.1 protein Tob1-like [Oppia nitens]
MHVEIQVALNFLISFLYNKLPRRRVNQFGEELENALKIKFEGHWYPEKPYKGSAYRCIRCSPPLDPTVFETAARSSGMDLSDIQENLPQELSIWVDPGEVSYRMSEKGPVKILYSEKADNNIERENIDRQVTRTFNPEAQCFKPIECLTSQFGGLNLTNGNAIANEEVSPPIYKNNVSPITPYMVSKTSTPVTYTAGTFAATKFGSTKLKSNTKRSHRMSPTEFSNYIKQRALQQQTGQQSVIGLNGMTANTNLFSNNSTSSVSPHNSRSLSPNSTQMDSTNNFMLMTANGGNSPTSPNGSFGGQQNVFTSNITTPSKRSAFVNGLFDTNYLSELVGTGDIVKANHNQHQSKQTNGMNRFTSFLDKTSPFMSSANPIGNSTGNSFGGSNANFGSLSGDSNVLNGTSGSANNSSKSFDNMNFNVNGVSYPNQYQHLLVAN